MIVLVDTNVVFDVIRFHPVQRLSALGDPSAGKPARVGNGAFPGT